MSYQVALFGVPAATPLEDVLPKVTEVARELRFENGYDEVYLVTPPGEEVRATGLRPLHVLALGARGAVPREFFTERFRGRAFFEIVYDDRHGIFLWGYHPPKGRTQSILSDGHHVGFANLTTSVDYPQRPFTRAELDAALAKPEARRTPAEARALTAYHDALTIGLAHAGFATTRHALLRLAEAKMALPLLSGRGELAPLPDAADVVASSRVEPYDFKRHALEPRAYY